MAVGDQLVQHALKAAHITLVRRQPGERQGGVRETAIFLQVSQQCDKDHSATIQQDGVNGGGERKGRGWVAG